VDNFDILLNYYDASLNFHIENHDNYLPYYCIYISESDKSAYFYISIVNDKIIDIKTKNKITLYCYEIYRQNVNYGEHKMKQFKRKKILKKI
jgi:hypothetical protein